MSTQTPPVLDPTRALLDGIPRAQSVAAADHARLYQGRTTNLRTPGGGFAPVFTSGTAAGDVPEGGTLLVQLGAEAIALYNLAGTIYATANVCTHGEGSLCAGRITGQNIECPLHLGLFHIPSGRAVGVPCIEDARSYPVRVEDGVIYVKP